jgi:hypothetical protein
MNNQDRHAFYRQLGANIKAQRSLIFVDKVRIFQMTGIKPATIDDLENECLPTAPIPIEKIALLAKLLDCSLEDLVPKVEINAEHDDQAISIAEELTKRGPLTLIPLKNVLQQALEMPKDKVDSLIVRLLEGKRLVMQGDQVIVGDLI